MFHFFPLFFFFSAKAKEHNRVAPLYEVGRALYIFFSHIRLPMYLWQQTTTMRGTFLTLTDVAESDEQAAFISHVRGVVIISFSPKQSMLTLNVESREEGRAGACS